MDTQTEFGTILISRLTAIRGGKEPYSLPIDYRSSFISIIKAAVEGYDPLLYELIFLSRTVKPYTFAVSFGDGVKISDNQILSPNSIEFKFGTLEPKLLIMLYNHLITKRTFNIYNTEFSLEHVHTKRPRRIKGSEALLRTLSPVLIRSHKNEKHCLCPPCSNFPGDAEFHEALSYNMEEMSRHLGDMGSYKPELEAVRLKRIIITHMGLKLPGFVGTFLLRADPRLLNLVITAGMGSRRSQGFGMVDVVMG